MEPLKIILILLTHGIPILFFTYMMTILLARPTRKIEHKLLAALAGVFMLLFIEELVRNLSPIEFSPFISSAFFSTTGILNVCVSSHYILQITKMYKKLPSFLFPAICYFPLIGAVINIFTGAQLFSTQQFEQISIWIYPIYNINYYLTLIGSVFMSFLIIMPLHFSLQKAENYQHDLLRSLAHTFTTVAILCFLLGLIQLQPILPPYPYMYAGIYFCYSLQKIMQKLDYLELHDKRFEKLFNLHPDAIFLLDKKMRVHEANPIAKRLLHKHQLPTQTFIALINKKFDGLLQQQEKIQNVELHLTLDTHSYTFIVNRETLLIDYEMHSLLIFNDITQLHAQQQEILFLAYHDPLTKLPNRRYFFEHIHQQLQLARVNGEVITIYMIDVNNLKMVNDIKGHAYGDELIVYVASVLRALVKDFGIVARVGGDEFIVSLNESQSMLSTKSFTNQLNDAFVQKLEHFNYLPIGTSIGYSKFPLQSENVDELISLADSYMYEMKKTKNFFYR